MRVSIMLPALAVVTVTATAQPSEYVVPFVEDAPEIDAMLGESVWDAAPEPPAFTEMGLSTREAANTSDVRILAGPEALYLGFELTGAPGEMPVAEERERDGATHMDDSLEVFVNPDPLEGRWYRLCVNAVGSFADTISDPALQGEERVRWAPEWQRAAASHEGGWTAEMALPWELFGAEGRPHQGWVWRIRIGRIGKKFPNSMWPHNSAGSFHNESCQAYLVFGDRNVLANGGFEGPVNEAGQPAGWVYSYNPEHGTGEVAVSTEGAQQGEQCIRYEKFDNVDWYPQLHSEHTPIQGGSTYEYSGLFNCPVQFIMRWAEYDEEGRHKHSTLCPATDGWERRSIELPVRSGMSTLTVGAQLRMVQGVLLVDDVRVVRRNDIQLGPPELPGPHRYHDLQELASRTRFKPYALLRREDGSFDGDRVVLRDSGTGAEIWMLTRSANGKRTRHFYMEASPWNADHSQLCLYTGQLGKGNALMPADGSRYYLTEEKFGSYIWDRVDPNRLYFTGTNEAGKKTLNAIDLATGETEVLREFEGSISLWPTSQDGKYVLVKETLKAPDFTMGMRSTIWLVETDGSDAISLDPGDQIHQLWFSKRPDHSVEFNYSKQTGISGAWMMWPDGRKRQVADPHWTHRAHSPDGEWVTASGAARIIRWDGSEIRPIGTVSTMHNSWRTSPDWWAASSGRYLLRIAADGRDFVQRLGAHNSGMGMSTYWTEAHPEMSADGTKLAYASNMLHDIEFYNLVMMLPGAPRDLQATRDGDELTLSWQAPQYHAEIAGYLVYRSGASGRPGEQITPEPVASTTMTTNVAEGGPWYFTVSAIEHSGLEGVRSAEVCSDPDWPGAICHYVEAERAQYTQPANEVFDANASGLYAITLGDPQVAEEPAVLEVEVPRAGEYALLLRARTRLETEVEVSIDGETTGRLPLAEGGQWAWLRVLGEGAEPLAVALDVGGHDVAMRAKGGGVQIDRLCLLTPGQELPKGRGGCDVTAPDAVQGASAQARGRYAIELSWGGSDAIDLSHYNVYCGDAADFEVGQQRLVGSPKTTRFVDWGLKCGREYFYRVTAVDRRGNEGEPSEVTSATTETLDPRLFAELETPWSTEQADEVTLPFTMPEDGEVVVWGHLRSIDGESNVSVELRLDGERIDVRGLDLDYICTGHGGPVLGTWLWDCLRPKQGSPDAPMAYAVPAGEHELRIGRASQKGHVEFDRFIITNDLGFEPEGRTSFLIKDSLL